MEEAVRMFRGNYDYLSNMYSVPVEWDGRIYRSSEAAFQSAKSLDPAVRDEFSEMTGVAAKRAGKKVKLRGDWESVKDGIMEEVVRAKFSQNPELLVRLIETGNMELVEGNRWHDTYWGVDLTTGRGENHLGEILMKIRAELGGAYYLEKARKMKEEKAEVRRDEEAALRKAGAGIEAELNALPEYDFAGIEMETKAFGRVKILGREGNRLRFEARGAVKMFSYPGCILQGFLIPDDRSVIAALRRRQVLGEKLQSLKKYGLPEQDETHKGLYYHEENRDLFDGTEDYYLAHCISADFSVVRGVAAQIDRRFGIGAKLMANWPVYLRDWDKDIKQYDCLQTGGVFNLVAKAHDNSVPTYDTLRGALEIMRCVCLEKGIKKVAMPKLTAGLDWPNWSEVSNIIQKKFAGMDIEIMVCMPE